MFNHIKLRTGPSLAVGRIEKKGAAGVRMYAGVMVATTRDFGTLSIPSFKLRFYGS